MQHTAGAGTVLTAGTGTTYSTTLAGAATTAAARATYTPTGAGTANAARAGAMPFTVGAVCCTSCVSWTNVLHHTCGYCDPDFAPCVKVAAATVRPCVPHVFFSDMTDQ